jgi:4-hydroxy 2-oxovalerate aldolase
MSAPWITYRPEIKILDCTIRDGGLINDHFFEEGLVKAVYETCIEAGVDYMEVGYKASKKLFARDKFGTWKFCDEDDLRRVVGDNPSKLKLAAMADAEKTDYRTDILPKDKSVLDVIRVATYVRQIPVAVDMIKDAYDKGYEVTCNLMAISTVQEVEIDQALEVLVRTPASTVVVVDSFGSLYMEQIELLVKKYRKAVEGTGKEVGIHAHNNQQLAFANTIEAVIHGANRLDATAAGIGRGAGNCPMDSSTSTRVRPFNNAPALTKTIS